MPITSASLRRIILILVVATLPCAAQAKRIVSTAPSITEMLYALGLGDRVVGVTTYCRYPPEAQKKPKIGTYTEPNLEAVAALKPDLVLIQKNPIRLRDRLEALRLRVVEVTQDDLATLYDSFKIVGNAVGEPRAAEQLIAQLRSQLAEVSARAAKAQNKTRMVFVVGRTPNRLDGLMVVGRASYLNEIITIAGGENVFADATAGYPSVSLEEMIARNPTVVIDMGDMGDTVGVTERHKREIVDLWNRASTIQAVKQRRVHAVASDIYVVPGPRAADAARSFLQMLHPEVASK
jgi:iron complex transport system substrate-binding protein